MYFTFFEGNPDVTFRLSFKDRTDRHVLDKLFNSKSATTEIKCFCLGQHYRGCVGGASSGVVQSHYLNHDSKLRGTIPFFSTSSISNTFFFFFWQKLFYLFLV